MTEDTLGKSHDQSEVLQRIDGGKATLKICPLICRRLSPVVWLIVARECQFDYTVNIKAV